MFLTPPRPSDAAARRDDPFSVFVIDPSEMMQLAWHTVIDGQPDLLLIGSGAKVEEALRATTEGWADLVLISHDTDGANGSILAGALASSRCPTQVVFTGPPGAAPAATDPGIGAGAPMPFLDTAQPVRELAADLSRLVDSLLSPEPSRPPSLRLTTP